MQASHPFSMNAKKSHLVDDQHEADERKPPTFRRAFLRGLAVLLPPLLTVVIFLWIGATVKQYVLNPVEAAARQSIYWGIADVRNAEDVPAGDNAWERLPSGKAIPKGVYQYVDSNVNGARDHWNEAGGRPEAKAYYMAYIQARFLRPIVVVPVFLSAFIALLYFLGSFIAAGIGRATWTLAERGVLALPLVRNVYGSVKQVTDFMFSDNHLEFNRVVAVQYPRKGIWSIGFVTGESLADIHAAANEPVLSILIPTSPMPVTGYTVNCLKSEVLDLNITIDQALQFTISCGVVIPPHQLTSLLGSKQREMERLAAAADESPRASPPTEA